MDESIVGSSTVCAAYWDVTREAQIMREEWLGH